MRKVFEFILWFAAILPVCLIYTDNTADWGDDWACYYAEARNISAGNPISQTHFRFYDYNDHYAPPCYTAGYPLLLAPVVAHTGMDMRRLGWYMCLWAAAWVALGATMVRRRYGLTAAICGIVLSLLSPYIIEAKGRLWSDIPFSFFLLSALMLYRHRERPLYAVATGLCAGMAIAIRSIGIALLLAMCIDMAIGLVSGSTDARKPQLLILLRLCLATMIPAILLMYLYPAPAGSYYLRQYGTTTVAHVLGNLQSYLHIFDRSVTGHDTSAPVSAITVVILVAILTGMIALRRERILWLSCSMMLVLVVAFPDVQDMRYLIPLLPLAACYLAAGVHVVAGRVARAPVLLLAVLTVWVVWLHAAYYPGIYAKRHLPHSYGPFTQESQAGLRAISGIVPEQSLILCRWPRVVGLLTDRDCCVIPEGDTGHQIAALRVARPDYLLSIEERDPELTDAIATAHDDSLIYHDHGMKLYRCKNW